MRILVIEDEHKIANSLRTGLEHENNAVDVAYTGTDGYDLAATEDYDLLIIDRMLPGIDGVEITKKLREKNIHTPILMLTAKGQVENRVEGLDSGADDYVTKPFAFSELLARVRALGRRPKQSTGGVLSVGDLSIETTIFSVTRAGKQIHLSSKEYALLEYLVRHANQTITKEQIINHVWNYEAEVLPNSVEVYIKHLRDKIDKPFKPKPTLIHTVRGFGYKIG